MSINCCCEKNMKTERSYVPHKLRSRPFRCISLPLFCLFLFIIYWFAVCPLIFVGIQKQCGTSKCKWPLVWPYYYWIVSLFVFVLILSVIVCLWWCKPIKETNKEVEERQKEYEKLMSEAMDYNSEKRKTYSCERTIKKDDEMNKEMKPKNYFELKSISSENTEKAKEVKSAVVLKEAKHSEKTKNPKQFEEIKEFHERKTSEEYNSIDESENVHQPKTSESLVDEIDRMFPRCSIRRKDIQERRRPDTLILQSPKYPKEASPFRHTMTEETKTITPLSPREVFFYDLTKSAHKQTVSATEKFINNEKKHSSNNFTKSTKPEITDFILKQKPSTEAPSPEFFIANVLPSAASANEVFMYVNGAQPENSLTICYLDKDDDVFTE